VGRFYEFYGAQAGAAHTALGLRLVTGLRGFLHGCGFPRHRLGHYLTKARTKGFAVALIKAEREVDGSVRRRLAKLFALRMEGNGSGEGIEETAGVLFPPDVGMAIPVAMVRPVPPT
jgi:hypothetical protein